MLYHKKIRFSSETGNVFVEKTGFLTCS